MPIAMTTRPAIRIAGSRATTGSCETKTKPPARDQQAGADDQLGAEPLDQPGRDGATTISSSAMRQQPDARFKGE